MTIQSSWGLVVQEGEPGTGAYEILEQVLQTGTDLLTGDPPYVITAEEVPAKTPRLTHMRLSKLEETAHA